MFHLLIVNFKTQKLSVKDKMIIKDNKKLLKANHQNRTNQIILMIIMKLMMGIISSTKVVKAISLLKIFQIVKSNITLGHSILNNMRKIMYMNKAVTIVRIIDRVNWKIITHSQ